MPTLLPVLAENKDAGIEAIRKSSLQFLKRNCMQIDFPLTKDSARRAIGEVWDGVGSFDFRSLVTGDLHDDLSDDFLALIVTAVVRAQYAQYVAALPTIPPPHIGKS